MTDKKLTDNEIIKALECCPKNIICGQCPLCGTSDCMNKLYVNSLDLINRLQAENERLKKGWKADILLTQNTKAEAYKEFAERLKENSIATFSFKGVVMVEEIDDLLKELVGEEK